MSTVSHMRSRCDCRTFLGKVVWGLVDYDVGSVDRGAVVGLSNRLVVVVQVTSWRTVHRPVVLTLDPTQPQATRVTEVSKVAWADSRVALEVRECLVRAWEGREVPCSRAVECRAVECREVGWVLVDLRFVIGVCFLIAQSV